MNRRTKSNNRSFPRREILEAEGLEHAPMEVREVFWRHYNHKRKVSRGHPAEMLGDIATSWLSRQVLPATGRLRQIAAAWGEVVPAVYRRCSRVEGLDRGCLRVIVDSKATAYVLRRQLYGKLLSRLNDLLGRSRVTKIDFRIGPMTTTAR